MTTETIQRRTVRFSLEHSVFLYHTEPLANGHLTYRSRAQLSKERQYHQVIARKAVLSSQKRQLHENRGTIVHGANIVMLATLSAKLSRRARDIALENARTTFLEVYGAESSSVMPKFSDRSFKPNIPYKVSQFPSVTLSRKVQGPFDERETRSKRQRVEPEHGTCQSVTKLRQL